VAASDNHAVAARLVFITGASGGIGQALALRFYQSGYALALVARRGEQVMQWAEACGLDPQRWRVYAADVSDADSVIGAGRACIAQQGVPEVVVANAGISVGMDTAVRGDIDVMARLFAVNNVGLAATFHPFVDAMRRRGSGALVGIASVNGIRGFPGHGAYCASKAGVIAYCESLRGELRASGVRVVTLCPGYIDTPLTRGNRYSMPFLMPAERFADRAWRAIEAGDSYRVIPWQMAIVAKFLRVLPNRLFDAMFASRPRKRRADEA
jgi:short-subunit dehydrogenase